MTLKLVILLCFSGERTPLNDLQARGVIAGLSLARGRGHPYKVILEVNAYGVAHNMEAMRAAGAKPRRAVAVGDRVKTALALVVIHPLRYPLSLHHSDEGIVLGSERGML